MTTLWRHVVVEQQEVGLEPSDVVEGIGRVPSLLNHKSININSASRQHRFNVVVVLKGQHPHERRLTREWVVVATMAGRGTSGRRQPAGR